MRTLRITQDIITDRLPMKGAGDVVTVDDDFADHLISLGVAIELKIQPAVARDPVRIEKKTPGDALPQVPVSPDPIVRRRGRPAKS